MYAKLTNKGQITLPKNIRDALSLSPGDRLEFIIEKDHTVRLVAKQIPVKNLKGMLPKPNTPVSLEEMNRAILSGSYKS